MAQTPEGRVKAKVKKVIAEYGDMVYSEWPVPCGYGKSGLDCVGTIAGRSFYIETKAPGNRLTSRQENTAKAMSKAGAAVFVISNDIELDKLRVWLDSYASI